MVRLPPTRREMLASLTPRMRASALLGSSRSRAARSTALVSTASGAGCGCAAGREERAIVSFQMKGYADIISNARNATPSERCGEGGIEEPGGDRPALRRVEQNDDDARAVF